MKILRRVLPYSLCIFVIAFMPFAYKKTSVQQKLPISSPEHKCILTLWNIDVFEGGVGSRGDFLSNVATKFKSDGVLILVVNHTRESALNSIEQGEFPDMISYGVGVDFVVKYAKTLPKIEFSGGEQGGKIYAYPWCVGSYFLIRKNQDNQPIERLFISQNTYNLPFGAIYLGKIQAENFEYKKPLDAYANFLSGSEKDALLGTQRDLKRLEQRGVEFYAEPIDKFCDLIQYVSVLSQDKQRYSESVKFLEYLISQNVQQNLYKIGMASVFYNVYTDSPMTRVNFNNIEYTISPYTDSTSINKMISNASSNNITNNSLLDFKNMLKRL